MIWRPFLARVKVNHRRVYSRIFVKVCAVAMATGLGFFPSSFAHYELTRNPFCQHCYNKNFVIRRKSFSVVLKIPYVKIQIFRD